LPPHTIVVAVIEVTGSVVTVAGVINCLQAPINNMTTARV